MGLVDPMVCGILTPRPGIERESPALEDGFLTTRPPRKPRLLLLFCSHQAANVLFTNSVFFRCWRQYPRWETGMSDHWKSVPSSLNCSENNTETRSPAFMIGALLISRSSCSIFTLTFQPYGLLSTPETPQTFSLLPVLPDSRTLLWDLPMAGHFLPIRSQLTSARS